ncbi:MAG: hypothetical protein HY560_01255, partial [Gemmatimonadetes bacterium]|nr:hypothetical protein [Gemmatimonadota bacterium]
AYELIQRWAAANVITAGAAGACVRACDGALKLYEATLDREHVRMLERKVKDLEAELAARRALRRAT